MWEYSEEEKLSEAVKFKTSGTDKFKAKDFEAAIKDYEKAVEFSEDADNNELEAITNNLKKSLNRFGNVNVELFSDRLILVNNKNVRSK